ncbi:tensin-4 isoform X2 [Anoplophora glabripennis]|uniref:tensin-4 isoform X2 n=1 Tax=Anoplophora glabripennis TaxID=217634 RepID=UPI000873B4A1|nr:tensin-4 isoform X2 [Anoplophora glabripennis]
MGRLSKSTPSVRVNYRKLVDELGGSCDSLKIMPALPDYFSYCCHHCGHTQKLQTKELSAALKKDKSPNKNNQHQPTDMDVQLSNPDPSTLRLAPPSTIPGLKPVHTHKYNVLGPTAEKVSSQQSTPSSDESNSPTEMNSYKKMAEKPPLIKRIAMGLTGNANHNDEDSCPLVSDGNTSSTPGSPTNRPLSGGYVNETEESKNKSNNSVDNLKNEVVENNSNLTKHIEIDNTLLNAKPEKEFKCKRISQISSSSSSSGPQTGTENTLIGFTPTPPPLPERTDSLNNREEGELRIAPWFQAGIPREIALEILAQEPVGAFMVRESTSKPGCFALSLRVPRSFQPTGIAHYLIVRANKGYKIKGFTKEFTSLTSLITHHSVMPELLPCPLSLSRYHPSFVKTDSKRDFADIDLDPDYNTLADFRKMMADLNV